MYNYGKMVDMMEFWTDGSAYPNPGPGGFAVIEVRDGVAKPVILGRERRSSNVRMEGWAIILAIRRANGAPCEIHTDSKLWVNIATKWMGGWARNGWRKRGGEIANLDLVRRLYKIYDRNTVKLIWVRGHVGTKYNEMADLWAGRARNGAKLTK